MRPLYAYRVTFTHPDTPEPVAIPVVETTPCRAKNTALLRLDTFLKASPQLPNDNRWYMASVIAEQQVGYINQ